MTRQTTKTALRTAKEYRELLFFKTLEPHHTLGAAISWESPSISGQNIENRVPRPPRRALKIPEDLSPDTMKRKVRYEQPS